MKPHKHAELIKAWADGAEIQVRIASSNEWGNAVNPYWAEHYEYRIKPEPKPDTFVYPETVHSFEENKKLIWYVKDKLQLIFDGETGQLKKAVVLK
jgi:hypothetical protein